MWIDLPTLSCPMHLSRMVAPYATGRKTAAGHRHLASHTCCQRHRGAELETPAGSQGTRSLSQRRGRPKAAITRPDQRLMRLEEISARVVRGEKHSSPFSSESASSAHEQTASRTRLLTVPTERDFHGEKFANTTRGSATDAEAWLYHKGSLRSGSPPPRSSHPAATTPRSPATNGSKRTSAGSRRSPA